MHFHTPPLKQACCWVWSHRLEECVRVWSVCRQLCFGACVLHWGLMFPGFVVKLWASLQTTAVMWRWALTDSPQKVAVFPPISTLYTASSKSNSPAKCWWNISFTFPLSFSFIFFSLSLSFYLPPSLLPSLPLSLPLSFFPFPWGLCALPSRA